MCVMLLYLQAPEVFNMSYGYPSDIWSCGVMMYFVLSGEFPFKVRSGS
jgi:serine/threonine protein kinase